MRISEDRRTVVDKIVLLFRLLQEITSMNADHFPVFYLNPRRRCHCLERSRLGFPSSSDPDERDLYQLVDEADHAFGSNHSSVSGGSFAFPQETTFVQ
jgi:hypothetical protein